MKKALKIIGITLLVIFIFILIAPFIFEKQMVDYVKKTVNENLNATVAFTDTDLSFIRNFPQASLSLENLSVINNEPFEGDTLFFAENVSLNMSIKELFNSAEEPMKINDFQISDAVINIKIDSLGNSNYDIAIKEDAPVEDESKPSSGFSFDVQHYEIADSEALLLGGEGAVVGRHDLERAGGKPRPERILMALVTEGRAHDAAGGMVPVGIEIFAFVQRQMLDQRLAKNAHALLPRATNGFMRLLG